MFFTIVHPMEDDNCMEETPCDLTKPRIAPYKKNWKPQQNIVYWCNLKLAQERERIAILPNTVARNRPLQHTTSGLHRESGMHEDKGCLKPKGTLNSKSATSKLYSTKFANRSTK